MTIVYPWLTEKEWIVYSEVYCYLPYWCHSYSYSLKPYFRVSICFFCYKTRLMCVKMMAKLKDSIGYAGRGEWSNRIGFMSRGISVEICFIVDSILTCSWWYGSNMFIIIFFAWFYHYDAYHCPCFYPIFSCIALYFPFHSQLFFS